MTLELDKQSEEQIIQCEDLLKTVLGSDLLGIYLYGSALVGGLKKYSDIDLLVVTNRATNNEEKIKLIANLLKISGVYMRSSKHPIEMTLVVRSEVVPWHYPPRFDFHYGDWLRNEFINGEIEPWQTKLMPDLAILITQVLLASKPIFGSHANKLLSSVPYQDFIQATKESLPNLVSDLDFDTRNVLLTLSRIWSTVKTDQLRSKPDAATWAINQLPEDYKPVMKRARTICIGDATENWEDVREFIKPCADFMLEQINAQIASIESSDCSNKHITYVK